MPGRCSRRYAARFRPLPFRPDRFSLTFLRVFFDSSLRRFCVRERSLIISTMSQALNKGQKPPIIADRIEVQELNMGTIVSLPSTVAASVAILRQCCTIAARAGNTRDW